MNIHLNSYKSGELGDAHHGYSDAEKKDGIYPTPKTFWADCLVKNETAGPGGWGGGGDGQPMPEPQIAILDEKDHFTTWHKKAYYAALVRL